MHTHILYFFHTYYVYKIHSLGWLGELEKKSKNSNRTVSFNIIFLPFFKCKIVVFILPIFSLSYKFLLWFIYFTGFISTKPAIKSKPPPPVAPKPSVPSRPSLKRTTVPTVHRNSVESPKEVSTKENSCNNDNGIVYDSATLRLSVKEKISKLSYISQLMEKSVIEDKTDCTDCDAFCKKKNYLLTHVILNSLKGLKVF